MSAGNPQCQGPVSQMEASSGCSYSSQTTGAALPRSHICPSCASIRPPLVCLCCCVRGVGGRLTTSGGLRRKPNCQGGSPPQSFCLRELGWGTVSGSEGINEGWNQVWDPDWRSCPFVSCSCFSRSEEIAVLVAVPRQGGTCPTVQSPLDHFWARHWWEEAIAPLLVAGLLRALAGLVTQHPLSSRVLYPGRMPANVRDMLNVCACVCGHESMCVHGWECVNECMCASMCMDAL